MTLPVPTERPLLHGAVDAFRIASGPEPAWGGTAYDAEMIPLQEFIVKVYERCNLACDYCYLYEMSDQTWRDRAVRMSEKTFRRTAERIGEHARSHELDVVDIVFHGGEPLLRGLPFFTFAMRTLHDELPVATRARVRVQTNAVLLTPETLDVFASADVKVGVSIDGDRLANDRHRRKRNGLSSYDDVVRSIELLSSTRYRQVFSRLYATIDVCNDPVAVYEQLARFDPPMMDFHLPHGNWDTPPPVRDPRSDDAPYGQWLARAFDRWYDSPFPEPRVRMFTEIMNLLLGGHSSVETIGLSPAAMVVIETDGTIEQVDSLRSTFHGATKTGFDVFENSFDEVARHPAVIFRQLGEQALCDTCKSCAIHSICGGGYIPHRYSRNRGFDNPSVYCPDLQFLIHHVEGRLRIDLERHAQR